MGEPWAPTARPQYRLGLASLRDVLWDFTRTRQPSQSILISIYGYSLALDAESKDFQILNWEGRKRRPKRHRVISLKDDFFYGNPLAERQTCVEIRDQSWMNGDNQRERQFP